MSLPPISAKVMIDPKSGMPFVVSGPNDTTPQQVAIGEGIHVGSEPPPNPYVNQLWLDTSGG